MAQEPAFRSRPRDVAAAVAAVIAAIQGLLLIGTGVAVAWLALRDGVAGPQAVASPAGVVAEAALFTFFGTVLLVVARGLLNGSAAAATPFALAQALGLAVTIPLAQGGGATGWLGAWATAACLVGLTSWALLVGRRNRP